MAEASGSSDERLSGLLSRAALPVFISFYLWGFGTGALWMVRPLMAYDLSGSVFLVGLVAVFGAAPRTFGAPLSGIVADRIGRKPVVILGAVFHGGAAAGQAFADNYAAFLFLEFASGFGVAIWVTATSALLADFTRSTNRGRGVALRNTSQRIGILTGPIAGAIIASIFNIQAVFIFIALTKVGVIFVSWLFIAETRRADSSAERPRERSGFSGMPDLTMFKTRDFLALGVVTLALGTVTAGPGAFRTFFPVQAESVGMSVSDIGSVISVSGLAAMLVALPVGALVDWRGRKPVMLSGLGALALALYLVMGMNGLAVGLVVAVAFGIGEVVASNTTQTYAMDLAPTDRRGYFLGTWQATMNVGQLVGPLVVGGVATWLGLAAAFAVVGTFVLASAVFLIVVGRETHPMQDPAANP